MAIQVVTKFPTAEVTYNSALSGGEITGDTGAYETLVNILIADKFRFSQITREKIVATVKSDSVFYLFQQFTDGKQTNKKFIVTGIRHDVIHDQFDIELTEYDNDSSINIVLE